MEDLCEKWEVLSDQVNDLPPAIEVGLFVEALKPDLSIEVSSRRPSDIYSTMSLAKQFQRKTTMATTLIPAKKFMPGLPSSGNTTTKDRLPVFKRLTREEMAQRQKDKLCFYCDDKYSPGHKCKRLFFLDLIDEDDVDNDSGTLSSLLGDPVAPTMQLEG